MTPAGNSFRQNSRYFERFMHTKLHFLFLAMGLIALFLIYRVYDINQSSGNEYKRQVLMQQSYDSAAIPFKRGNITDRHGTVLASSSLVYNVILDSLEVLSDDAYMEPTLNALSQAFSTDTAKLRNYIIANPQSQYYVVARNVPYEAKKSFDDIVASQEKGVANIKGVWFEEAYIRSYPNGSLASGLLGFSGANNTGNYGLEQYYNDTLNGTPGRIYGYIDDVSGVEKTIIDATDGNNLVLTLDANIQSIIEKYLQKFNDDHENAVRIGNGARNIGCIVMNCNTGAILGMADYPGYDLNDPYDVSRLVGMTKLDFTKNDAPMQDDYLTAEDVAALTEEEVGKYLNALWKNFCISDYYEPGSVAKPFTVAAGLESGSFSPTATYLCQGSLTVAEGTEPIKCHNVYGDGVLTVAESVERSCNVALMQMAFQEGKETFTHFQNVFNFGLKTNVDLANEARTDSFIYSADNMGRADLATNSFGQNFNVTMIQMAAGFCSLINGGYYYQPYLVSRITSSGGAAVRNIEPRVIKKTISEETSDWIVSYCNQVVTGANGTGKTARPAGYMIGGKTGTAETQPRNMGQYVVSFMGYAPADDPQILIYVVVDRPNAVLQDDAKFATGIVRNVLTEILPYLGFPMTEPLSEKEMAELEELKNSGTIAMGVNTISAVPDEVILDDNGNPVNPENAEGENSGESGEAASDGTGNSGAAGESPPYGIEWESIPETDESWKNFPVDPETGYLRDPETGNLVDPETGHVFDNIYVPEHSAQGNGAEETAEGAEAGQGE